jgi:hypothetical protein
LIQAITTFFQYGKKPWRERLKQTLLALMGLGPLVEGANVWMGHEDDSLLFSGPVMYAMMKAIEVSVESIPESIIQVNGLLKSGSAEILPIQIIGVVSSIVAGAFIMMDGNFGFILSKWLASPGDPYFGWISKNGGWEKRRQMFGMMLFNMCYFAQFVFAMSLYSQVQSLSGLLTIIGVEFGLVCMYKASKRELFGFSMLSHTSTFNSYIAPMIVWACEYLLVSAVPFLIAGSPLELGPELFAGIIVWRLLTNGGIIYLALGQLQEDHYLNMTTGMRAYAVSMAGAAIGLALFFMNCDKR